MNYLCSCYSISQSVYDLLAKADYYLVFLIVDQRKKLDTVMQLLTRYLSYVRPVGVLSATET